MESGRRSLNCCCAPRLGHGGALAARAARVATPDFRRGGKRVFSLKMTIAMGGVRMYRQVTYESDLRCDLPS